MNVNYKKFLELKVNRAKGEAVIKCDNEIDLGILQNAVQKEGYTLTKSSELNNNHQDSNNTLKNNSSSSVIKINRRYTEIGATFLFMIASYFILKQFNLLQGIPVEWRIDGKDAQGCAQIISMPSLGITERLSKDQPKIITFTPQKTGPIRFSCSMGMAGPGMFTVIANTKQ